MAGELPTIPLSELCIRITKGTTPTTLGFSFATTGVNFVKSEAITNDGRIDPTKFAYIDTVTHDALGRSILEEDDVLFSMAGVYLAKTAVVPHSILPANTNQAVGIIRLDRTKAVPRFIHYFLSSPICRGLVLRSVAQSAQPNFNLGDIGRLRIPQMSVNEQLYVSSILGALDDKIELNRKMNETLEALARAIFKSWFVDFDPVRAKAEGRQPIGMDSATAALFPDSFEDSELGEIPKGWKVGTVDEIATINSLTLSRSDQKDTIDYVEISEVMQGEVAKITRFKRGTEPSRAKRRLHHGDSVLSTVRPDRGAHFLCLYPEDTLIASTGFATFTSRDGNWAFLYSALTRPEFGQEMGRLADGGAYPAIRPEVIGGITLILPHETELTTQYHRTVAPVFELAHRNRKESQSLANLRDTLLPKLMSGEISTMKTAREFICERT